MLCKLRYKLCVIGLGLIFLGAGPVSAGTPEVVSSLADQVGVAVTIYNKNLALIKDHRRLQLNSGTVNLAFRGVSAKMQPETALFTANGLSVIEQNFEFDLLTPKSLLQKYVGHQVEVIKRHPTTGVESREKATVLSTNNGVVLKFADRIESGVPGRLAFSSLPENLRDKPTLTMLLESRKKGEKDIELSYLSRGLNWQADYVAELNAADNAVNLSGWVTLTNTSGTTYHNAKLQLVAGDVHKAPIEREFTLERRQDMRMAKTMAAAPNMAQEDMFEYHLYTLGRPTTIADKQKKQVALLQADTVPCKKEFLVRGSSYYYRRTYGVIDKRLKVGVFVEFANKKKNHLGMPLPKGVVRVYKEDSKGALQFVGEDRIDHTPENEMVRLKLGNYIYEAAFALKLRNAKAENVTIKVTEPIPGDWEILSESHKHKKESSSVASWRIAVPAKGETVLTYKVRVKF